MTASQSLLSTATLVAGSTVSADPFPHDFFLCYAAGSKKVQRAVSSSLGQGRAAAGSWLSVEFPGSPSRRRPIIESPRFGIGCRAAPARRGGECALSGRAAQSLRRLNKTLRDSAYGRDGALRKRVATGRVLRLLLRDGVAAGVETGRQRDAEIPVAALVAADEQQRQRQHAQKPTCTHLRSPLRRRGATLPQLVADEQPICGGSADARPSVANWKHHPGPATVPNPRKEARDAGLAVCG